MQKVPFIKENFQTNSEAFALMAGSIKLGKNDSGQILFQKGDAGNYYYIVLEGVYYI